MAATRRDRVESSGIPWPPPIEKGKPIPPRGGRSSDFTKRLEEMEVGDSILVPHTKRGHINGCRRTVEQRYGRQFVRRKVLEGVRVWRIK